MMIAMPFFYSISRRHLPRRYCVRCSERCSGEEKRKRVSPLMFALAVIFLLKYIFVR